MVTRKGQHAVWVAGLMMAWLTLEWSTRAFAGEADVVDVKITGSGERFNFSVTLKHADEGWDHYADKWEVVGPDGTIYGTRVLAHPHVDEQPFTRSLSGVEIPAGIGKVTVRAGDSVHGFGGREMEVTLPGR